MKKLYICLTALILLVSGCGGSKNSDSSKVCTYKGERNIGEITLTATAEDEKVKTLKYEVIMSYPSQTEITEEQQEELTKYFEDYLGNAKGITYDLKFEEANAIVEYNIDVEKADDTLYSPDILPLMMNEIKEISFEDFISEIENIDFECK